MTTRRIIQSIRRANNDVERSIVRQVIIATTEVHGALTRGTPVDTGWARANWVPSLRNDQNGPAETLPDEVRKRARKDGAQAAAGHVAVATAKGQRGLLSVIAGYKSIAQGSVFITNRVPYVPKLNESHREKSGFIQRAIDAGLSRVGRKSVRITSPR